MKPPIKKQKVHFALKGWRSIAILLYALLLLITAGCAQLPDYASPHLQTVPFAPSLDFIEYRQLERRDFQAKVPPASIRGNEHRINAHTSVSLRPSGPIRYTISDPNESFGLYKAYLGQLSFKAVMIPAYSWWNSQLAKNRTDYVLQHEQIHFALMEISARELNRKLDRISQKSFGAPERNIARQQLFDAVQHEIEASKTEIMKEHTRFDMETSLQYAPETQKQWFKRCQEKLELLSVWSQ